MLKTSTYETDLQTRVNEAVAYYVGEYGDSILADLTGESHDGVYECVLVYLRENNIPNRTIEEE